LNLYIRLYDSYPLLDTIFSPDNLPQRFSLLAHRPPTTTFEITVAPNGLAEFLVLVPTLPVSTPVRDGLG
jgi:hypothetical protein